MITTIAVSILSVIGIAWLLLRMLIPVIEALWFAAIYVWLNIDWKTVRFRYAGWLFIFYWRAFGSRLFGVASYYNTFRAGGWEYGPLFIVRRIK